MFVKITIPQLWARRVRRLVTSFSDERLHHKAVSSGYRAQGAKIATGLRREIRRAGYRNLARCVKSQLRTKKRNGGRFYRLRVGINKKHKKYARIWHILNLGSRPHVQPRGAILVPGTNQLVRPEGGRRHPGTQSNRIRDRAGRPVRRDLQTVFYKAYKRTLDREWAKRK